ncbi:MAG: glycoside hydrolase family 1 protein [Candidatus Falkowbacteria bacterium]
MVLRKTQNPLLDLRTGAKPVQSGLRVIESDKEKESPERLEHKKELLEKIKKFEKLKPEDQDKAVPVVSVPETIAEPRDSAELVTDLSEKEKIVSLENTPAAGAPKKIRAGEKKSLPEVEYETLEFPEGFLWGTATSAYQIEGGIKNDWSEWERSEVRIEKLKKEGKNPEDYICGQACDSFNRYREDLDLAKSLNSNAIRLGIEWARLEPERGSWDVASINHYRSVLAEAKKRNLVTVVTLWHWTAPDWFAREGGWEKEENIEKFLAYADMAVKELGAEVDYWVTMNEPMVPIGFGYLAGSHPPGKKLSLLKSRKVYKNLVRAHRLVYELIHDHFPRARVGITNLSNYPVSSRPRCLAGRILARLTRYFATDLFFGAIKNKMDFIGLNYYKRSRIVWYPPFIKKADETAVNDMGWETYPAGIYYMLKYLDKYKLPILITENGTADADDDHRANYIRKHLEYVHRSIKEGVVVKGYFHWSLLDNFEWARGWEQKFGLYAVDRKTFKRTARPSAAVYREICKTNLLKIKK